MLEYEFEMRAVMKALNASGALHRHGLLGDVFL